MRYLLLLWLSILIIPAQAEMPKTSCNDSKINRQWEQALAKYPGDPLFKLMAVRKDLCNKITKGQINAETARSRCEQALTDALLERAREEQAQRGLLRLFGTF